MKVSLRYLGLCVLAFALIMAAVNGADRTDLWLLSASAICCCLAFRDVA